MAEGQTRDLRGLPCANGPARGPDFMIAALRDRTGVLARSLLLAAIATSTWVWLYRLDDYPPWLDFDSATLGIFVNNGSFHDDYAFGFRGSITDQNRYRANWAAEFLPATMVLSRVQRALDIAPDRVGDLLEAAGLLFGALGLACVIAVARHRGGATLEEGLFLAGFTASLPAFLLYLRTTQPHFLFSFLMFWLAVVCIDRYLESGSGRALTALAVTMSLYALCPYVPLVVLPLVGTLLALVRRRAVSSLRDPRLYAAAALSGTLYASVQYAVAVTHEPSWREWNSRASEFLLSRMRHTWPGDLFDSEAFLNKLEKLWHQHFWHQWDKLGDQTRNDHLWTLPEPHFIWLALVPVALFGAWQAGRRDPAAVVFGAVLLSTYGLALTVGTTEGRYLLTAVPALAYFVLSGLRAVGTSRALYPALLGAVLLATTVNSFALVRGEYERSATRRWGAMAGMREALALIRATHSEELGTTTEFALAWPDLRYETWIYLEMLGNMRVKTFTENSNLAEIEPGRWLFACVETADAGAVEKWKHRGFRESGEAVDGPTGRRISVLASPP